MDRDRFAEACASLGLRLSVSQLDAFERFERRLYEQNAVMNLTRVPVEECWQRHFLDSVLFQDLLPEGVSVLDIGTGPGLPAWPLACARPDLHVTALDASAKMIAFLETVPLPNLSLVNARAESFGVRDRFDVVTGRAVAPIPAQLEISAAPCKLNGRVILMRTPAERDAIKAFNPAKLGLQPAGLIERELPGAGVVRLFPVYKKTSQTADKYPRRWAEIKAKPL